MDDFVISNLHESRNEWCSRLISIFTPLVDEGFRSLFNEAWKMCVDTDEMGKYLMTFQNLLTRIPKWNSVIIEEERKRIIERSGCNYLEDLISCVHIIQLKVLTCIRTGNKQKKIDISVPKLDNFIHKIYLHTARKIYSNVYLFEKNVNPLQMQKNARELELIINECIMITIRESIPTESIIRAYTDESVEQDEEVFIETMREPEISETKEDIEPINKSENEKEDTPTTIPIVPSIQNIDDEPVITKLTFNDLDHAVDINKTEEVIQAPKTLERLEDISMSRALERRMVEDDDYEDDDRIKIHSDNMDLSDFDILDSTSDSMTLTDSDINLDYEEI